MIQGNDLHIYIDDLLISTNTYPEYLDKLRLLFRKIFMSGMTLKFRKCEFIRQRITFLGHIITPTGSNIDPSKLQVIHDFLTPRNKKDLQSFVGLCNFYRKFSEHHATLIKPLIILLKKEVPWPFWFY